MSLGTASPALVAEATHEVAVLSTLAQLGWVTTEHIHALCFPHSARATVRVALRAFEDAYWVQRARWRAKGAPGSHIWTLLPKGKHLLAQYGSLPTRQHIFDIDRPSTALEHNEWRIGLAVRTLITRLICEARQVALLAQCSVLLPNPWHGLFVDDVMQLPPDVIFSITWQPHVVYAATWLPWASSPNMDVHACTNHYAVFFDRASWMQIQENQQTITPFVRILPMHNIDSYKDIDVSRHIQQVGQVHPWSLVEHKIVYLLQPVSKSGE